MMCLSSTVSSLPPMNVLVKVGDQASAESRFPLDTPYGWMDNPVMEWRDLELFCEVVQHGGF